MRPPFNIIAATVLLSSTGCSMIDRADTAISLALESLPKTERRALILTYLGFPFYDIATLPLLQGEGLDDARLRETLEMFRERLAAYLMEQVAARGLGQPA